MDRASERDDRMTVDRLFAHLAELERENARLRAELARLRVAPPARRDSGRPTAERPAGAGRLPGRGVPLYR